MGESAAAARRAVHAVKRAAAGAYDSIAYVSPHYGDPVYASGYQFVCPKCGWRSPVMKYIEGAIRHRDQHTDAP